MNFRISAKGFPHTLTLSLGEREQRAAASDCSNARPANTALSLATNLRNGLPLPEGEGWGDGEPGVAHPTVKSSRTVLAAGERN